MGGGGRDEWQLRFVGTSYDGTQQATQKWKGKLYVRHGGPELVGWWIQDREWKQCWPLEGDLPESVYASRDILVYCRKHDLIWICCVMLTWSILVGRQKCTVSCIVHR
jgi:hypothetical protein